MMEIEKAIKHFKNMRDENFVVLDAFRKEIESGKVQGSTIVYDNRHLYYSLAIEALQEKSERESNLISGMCCDCQHGTGKTCMDYSENDHCDHKKEDGSCWVAIWLEQSPLTLEQLREIEGEPVWMVLPKTNTSEHCEKWTILERVGKNLIFHTFGICDFEFAKFYAHKPKEESH